MEDDVNSHFPYSYFNSKMYTCVKTLFFFFLKKGLCVKTFANALDGNQLEFL